MPKGKGMLGKGAIRQALQADLASNEVVASKNKSVKAQQKGTRKSVATKAASKTTKKSEQVREIERISITIDKAMLRKIDAHIFNQKQSGKSANRSRFITEAIASAVNKL